MFSDPRNCGSNICIISNGKCQEVQVIFVIYVKNLVCYMKLAQVLFLFLTY